MSCSTSTLLLNKILPVLRPSAAVNRPVGMFPMTTGSSVKRCLWATNHDENRATLERLSDELDQRMISKYNFDFKTETVLKGDFEWEKVSKDRSASNLNGDKTSQSNQQISLACLNSLRKDNPTSNLSPQKSSPLTHVKESTHPSTFSLASTEPPGPESSTADTAPNAECRTHPSNNTISSVCKLKSSRKKRARSCIETGESSQETILNFFPVKKHKSK